MRRTPVTLVPCVIFLAGTMLAQHSQTFSARSSCGIAKVHQTVVIADEDQHTISLDQRTCQWEKPIELAGLPSNEYVSSGVDDVQFDRSKDVGYGVGKITNGDKYFIRYEGTSTLKNGVPMHLTGVWKFTGGTGKLHGLTGRGTYTAQPTAEGGMVFLIEGKHRVRPRHP